MQEEVKASWFEENVEKWLGDETEVVRRGAALAGEAQEVT